MQHTKKFLASLVFVFGLVAAISALTGAASPAKPIVVSCVVELVYEFRAQNGSLLGTETYLKEFTVSQDSGFVDDYSTPTRFKEFSANVSQVGREVIVDISWFSDVSTFDSVDLNNSLVLDQGQRRGRITGSQRFSTTAGHRTVTYNLVAVRNQ